MNQVNNKLEKYYCNTCNYNTSKKANLDKHLLTASHKNQCLLTKIDKKVATNYDCSLCMFTCTHSSQYKRHVVTIKHINKLNTDTSKNPDIKTYACRKCQKEYEKYNSYWRHESKCNFDPIDGSSELYSSTISKLLLENQELRNFIIEQSQERNEESKERNEETKEMMKMMVEQNNKLLELSKSNVNNNNSNNTVNGNLNNNRFNINVFLNEKCKDAMNFKDFIQNIDVTYEDLENNGKLGFVAGITKIFLDNLKQIDIFERPIHCTDVKRETMYIKEEDKWEKEEDKNKLSKAITEISRKSVSKLCQLNNENKEEYEDGDSEMSNKTLLITKNSIAGYNREAYSEKIIKTIAKETMVSKDLF